MGRQNCKSKNICTGDLKYFVELQKMDLTSPLDVDFREVFTKIADVWAFVETAEPRFTFDNINIDEGITHNFYIRFRSDVDITHWFLYKGERFKIISIKANNFDKKILKVRCNLKGLASQESSKW